MNAFLISALRPALLASGFALCLSPAMSEAATSSAPVVVRAQPGAVSPSKAEVLADYLVWHAAGMDRYGDEAGDSFSPRYDRDHANYVAVRNSPQFAVIKRDIEQGHVPAVVLTQDPLSVSIATP